MSVHSEFVQVVRGRLKARNLSLRAAASRAGLPVRSVQGVFEGHVPSIERAAEICRALGLEFYIGPPRGEQDGVATQASEPPPADAGVPEAALDLAAFASDVKEALREELGALRTEAQAMRREIRKEIGDDPSASLHRTPPANDLEDARALAVATVGNSATDVASARSVQMIEMEAAAGGGAYNLDDAPVRGPVWFRRDWIDSRGIDPTQAVVISVRGDSMEPTLPAGCKILVNRQRRRRRVGNIYVITTTDGLIVKRMGKDENDGWLLVSDSDSPDWPDVPWPEGAVLVGEVKWMARELP